MNWYIGQKIIAVADHKEECGARFKKGDVFTITGIKKGCCNSTKVLIAIGLTNSAGNICWDCKTSDNDPICWYRQSYFAPVEEISAEHEKAVEELLEELNLVTT